MSLNLGINTKTPSMIFWISLTRFCRRCGNPPSFERTDLTPPKAVRTSDNWLILTETDTLAATGLPGSSKCIEGTDVTPWSKPAPDVKVGPTSWPKAVLNFWMNSSTAIAPRVSTLPSLDSTTANSCFIRCTRDSSSTMVTGSPLDEPVNKQSSKVSRKNSHTQASSFQGRPPSEAAIYKVPRTTTYPIGWTDKRWDGLHHHISLGRQKFP